MIRPGSESREFIREQNCDENHTVCVGLQLFTPDLVLKYAEPNEPYLPTLYPCMMHPWTQLIISSLPYSFYIRGW